MSDRLERAREILGAAQQRHEAIRGHIYELERLNSLLLALEKPDVQFQLAVSASGCGAPHHLPARLEISTGVAQGWREGIVRVAQDRAAIINAALLELGVDLSLGGTDVG
jgi:hypothetical protein